jgi:hypothetical protein
MHNAGRIFQDDLLRSASWTLADQNSGELKMGYDFLFLGILKPFSVFSLCVFMYFSIR